MHNATDPTPNAQRPTLNQQFPDAFSRGVLGVLLMAAVAALLSLVHDEAVTQTEDARIWLMNTLPLALLGGLFLAVLGRPLTAGALLIGAAWLIYQFNAVKLEQLATPVVPDDVLLLGQVLSNPDFFSGYYQSGGAPWMTLALFTALPGVLLGLWCLDSCALRLGWITRALLGALALAGLGSLYQARPFWHPVYAAEIYEQYQYELWEPETNPARVGLFATQFDMLALVERFAQRHAAQLQQVTQPPQQTASADAPDIVIVQSESFFDPGVLRGIEPGQYIPQFQALAAQGISGALRVPAFGGGTIRTEFEVLTGYPLAAFPDVQYPYYGFVDARNSAASLPWQLRALGYTTTWIHPFKSTFWARKPALTTLGFEHMLFDEAFAGAPRKGSFVADDALYEKVLAQLEKTPQSPAPQFIMAASMQGHGHWMLDAGALGEAFAAEHELPAALQGDGKKQGLFFFSQLVDIDRSLGRFAQQLLAREKWTILLFYGDHLPALTQVFEQLGFDEGEHFDRHITGYFIVSNRPLPVQQRDLAAHQLSGVVLELAQLPQQGQLALNTVAAQVAAEIAGKETAESPDEDKETLRQLPLESARLQVQCGRPLDMAGRCP